MRGTDTSIDMGVSMLFVTDKDNVVTNQSLHRVSITKVSQKSFPVVLTELCFTGI